jgi:hypothetical protein
MVKRMMKVEETSMGVPKIPSRIKTGKIGLAFPG